MSHDYSRKSTGFYGLLKNFFRNLKFPLDSFHFNGKSSSLYPKSMRSQGKGCRRPKPETGEFRRPSARFFQQRKHFYAKRLSKTYIFPVVSPLRFAIILLKKRIGQ
jgi:hypothetical protein